MTGRCEVDGGAGTERDDRLTKGEDDHEVVTFGEVRRHQPPLGDAEGGRSAPIESDGDEPQRRLHPTGDERCPDQQPDHDRGGAGEGEDCAPKAGLMAADDQVEGDVTQAHHAVGDGEAECAVTEGIRDREGDDDQTGHRAQHHDPNRALLRLDEARQPRIADPCPPEHRQHQHRSADPHPIRLGRHQRGALGEAEHEDEVEEELEWFDRLSLTQLGAQSRDPLSGGTGRCHGSILVQLTASTHGDELLVTGRGPRR